MAGSTPDPASWEYVLEGSGFVTGPGAARPRRSRWPLRVVLAAVATVAALLLAMLVQRALVQSGDPAAAPTPAAVTGPAPATPSAAEDLPVGASRFVPSNPIPLLDIPAAPPAGTRNAPLPPAAGANPVAVALSLTVADAARAGAVTVASADPAPAPQLQLAGPGATTSTVVVVRVDPSRVIRVRSAAGGRILLALVGVFEPVSAPSAAGRTIMPASPQRVAHR